MKNGKRLTVNEHQYLKSLKLQSENWLISKKQTDKWIIIHKLTGRAKEIVAPNK